MSHDPFAVHTALLGVAIDEFGWDPVLAAQLATVAIRRWRSFDPSGALPDARVDDLLQGLRQGCPIDVSYLGASEFERLAPRFGEILAGRP